MVLDQSVSIRNKEWNTKQFSSEICKIYETAE